MKNQNSNENANVGSIGFGVDKRRTIMGRVISEDETLTTIRNANGKKNRFLTEHMCYNVSDVYAMQKELQVTDTVFAT